ncbi:MAG: rod-binding protein [Hydrogenovibrio crunogenus]|uniref:Peptidoglycan hydrolase FlgJ n=1 Tax=Hydrogenovibrio crunogenus (strain DSM 25203 / XCL-2) TaxID=317025 RepID=Q31FL5_HYDCU|nr:rod-binding protein [Hydrogenovibrio crunogenus]
MAGADIQVPKLEAYQQIYGNGGSFNDLKQTAKQDQKAALRPVAEQFEAMFLSQILKEARKVKFDDGFMDGEQADFYKDWYDKQLSQTLAAKGSLGLADKIVEQLSPKLPSMTSTQYKELLESRENKQASQSDDLPIESKKPVQTTSDSLALRQLK